jgi:hypothetical protein
MRHGASAGRAANAEVTVFEAGSKAAILEDGVFRVRSGEFELATGHDAFLPNRSD